MLSIALAVVLLLGVERIRSEARESFASTISGTDLIVGARSSPVHLLLYSVFRIGNATNNVAWDSYTTLASRPEVAWTIPLSLGDSHRGYRVLGTTGDYFEHFRFARGRKLEFAAGKQFEDEHDAVLGAEVAEALGYKPGQSIVIAHGAGDVSFSLHKDHPFRVVGILARTGTPVDRTVHVTLAGMDAVHAEHDEASTDPLAAAMHASEEAEHHDAPGAEHEADDGRGHAAGTKRAITAFLVGLKSRGASLSVQRLVNEYAGEPLTAILPGPTLQEVWDIVGAAEKTLLAVSALVVVVGLGGHARRAAHEPERAPQGNGHSAFGRCSADACIRLDLGRGGVPYAFGHRPRVGGPVHRTARRPALAGIAARTVDRRGLAVAP